jgi:ribosomal-protein-alanine N-acetyltransferase
MASLIRLLKRLEMPLPKGDAADFPADFPLLETQRLLLRAPTRNDARDLFRYAADPLVSRYVVWQRHETIADSRRFLNGVIAENCSKGGLTFAVQDKNSHAMIGTLGFNWIDNENHVAEAGYSFSREYWGKGLATEALRALLGFGFDTLKLNRIEGQCDARNPASGRVMEKCGMRREGILRQRYFLKGVYTDMILYAALKNDTSNDL